MSDKFTVRDFLVYTLVGTFGFVLIHFHENEKFNSQIISYISISSFVIIFVPILLYLFGHIIMGIDDILFNKIFSLLLKKKKHKTASSALKVYNYLLFGYRNQGVKWVENINDTKFLKKCDKLIKRNQYDKAEYYLIMSDLFKGIFLCLTISIIFDMINLKYSYLKILVLIITWYRARIFSTYYVKMIIRLTK